MCSMSRIILKYFKNNFDSIFRTKKNSEINRSPPSLNARNRNRTGTGFNSRRILSPVRLPVPPPGLRYCWEQYLNGNNRARTCDPLLVRQMLSQLSYAPIMATRKGLEPSTSGVTGQRSNQLSYRAIMEIINTYLLFCADVFC